MSKGIFITGTDTGIGKTWVTIMLMEALKRQGYRVAGMKPIASGANIINGKLVNEDALLLQAHCSEVTKYDLVNPFAFELPVAPHIAAQKSKRVIDIDKIAHCFDELLANNDLVIVEGVGGWRVPLSETLHLSDLVRSLELPVIMVVGIKVGCINHALITEQAIMNDGLQMLGWIGNFIDDACLARQEIIDTLSSSLHCRHLSNQPYINDLDSLVDEPNLDISSVLRLCNELR